MLDGKECIRRLLLRDLFFFLFVAIVGILWLFSFRSGIFYILSRYETRAAVLLMILINYLTWRSVNYCYVSDGGKLKACELIMMLSVPLFSLIFLFDLKKFVIYFFTIFVLIVFLKLRYYKLLMFLPVAFMDIRGMALYIILLTLFFLDDLFLLKDRFQIFLFASLVVCIFLEFLEFYDILKLFVLLTIIFYILKIITRPLVFVSKLIILALVSLIFSVLPASNPEDIYQAMFHVVLTCSYAIFFVIFGMVLGRRGWIRFPGGYSNYLKLIYLGIIVLSIHQMSYIFRELYFPSFLLIGIYGTLFFYVSYKIYSTPTIQKENIERKLHKSQS